MTEELFDATPAMPYRMLTLPKASCIAEVMCLVFVAVAGGCISLAYSRSLHDPLRHPYPITMTMFYPAVFFAGGHGMGTTAPSEILGLEDFLSRRSDVFDVARIPNGIELEPMTTPFELTHMYHIYAVGWFWRLFGVSIGNLMRYAALLYLLSACALYGIFRLGLSRLASVVGVLLVCTSPAMLYMCTNLRDFAKTPFILFCLLIMLRLLIWPIRGMKLLCMAAGLGLLLGFGLGFRQDMMVCLPPALALLLFFVHVEGARPWRFRLVAALIFMVIFVPLARPIFHGARLEGNQASVHSFFQGISPDVEAQLNFGGASYESLYWTDAGLYAQANVLARRLGDDTPMINTRTAEYRWVHGDRKGPRLFNPGLYYTGAEYARYASILMREVFLLFPADLVARAWSAVSATYDMPLDMLANLNRVQADFPDLLTAAFRLHEVLAIIIQHVGLVLVCLMILAVSARNLRIAVGLTALLLWFTGYPSIFFEYRHIAYLIFVPIGAFLMWCEWGLTSLYRTFTKGCRVFWSALVVRRTVGPESLLAGCPIEPVVFRCPGRTDEKRVWDIFMPWPYLRPVANMFLLFVLVLLAIWMPLCMLRWWQTGQVIKLADRLELMPRLPVDVEFNMGEQQTVVMPSEPLPGLTGAPSQPSGETSWEYLAAVFDTRGRDIPVTLQYDRERVIHDFTQETVIHGAHDETTGRVTFFFPVYETSTLYSPQLLLDWLGAVDIWQLREMVDPMRPIEEQSLWLPSKFIGISFPQSLRNAFVGLYRVADLNGLTYLPLFQLPEDRKNLRPFKTGRWERCFSGSRADF